MFLPRDNFFSGFWSRLVSAVLATSLSTLITLQTEWFSKKVSARLQSPSKAPHCVSNKVPVPKQGLHSPQRPGNFSISSLHSIIPTTAPSSPSLGRDSAIQPSSLHSWIFPLPRQFLSFLSLWLPCYFFPKDQPKYYFFHEYHSTVFNSVYPVIRFINSVHYEPTALSLYHHCSIIS